MSILIEEVIFRASADMAGFNASIDQGVRYATNRFMQLRAVAEKPLKAQVGTPGKNGAKEAKEFQTLQKEMIEQSKATVAAIAGHVITPTFDFDEIHEFNTLMSIKQAHWAQLRKDVEQNPIQPAFDESEMMMSIDNQIAKTRELREEFAKPLQFEVQAIAPVLPAYKPNETNPTSAFLPLSKTRDQSYETGQGYGMGQEGEPGKRANYRAAYYRSSAEPEKKIIKSMVEDMRKVFRDSTKDGIESGMDTAIEKIKDLIPNTFDIVMDSIVSTIAAQFTNVFLEQSGINKAVEERVVYVKSVAKEYLPQIVDPIKEKAGIIGQGIRRFTGKVGIDAIETIEDEKLSPTEKKDNILKSMAETYKAEAERTRVELENSGQNFDLKPIIKAAIAPALSLFDKTVKSNRLESLQDDAIPLVLQRASEIMGRNKKKNTGLVVDDDTEKLIIATGGYAGKRGLSGLRLPKVIEQDIEDKKKTKVIAVTNQDNDAADEILKADAHIYHGVMGTAKKLQSLDFPGMKQLGDLLSKAHDLLEMKPLSKAASLAKPNLRGYSKDAVEMSAQALVALEKNPTIKIKLIGESGGGFVAEEAAKVLSPSEPLGWFNSTVGLPFGFSKMQESQQVAGFYSHAFDHPEAYQENQLAEYQNAVKGKPGRMPIEKIKEVKQAISRVNDLDVSSFAPDQQLIMQKKLMGTLQNTRRHAITAEPDQQQVLNQLVKDVEQQFVRFSPEKDDLSGMRYGLEIARSVFKQHKESPSIGSALDSQYQLKGLKEAFVAFQQMAKNDPKNLVGTEEQKKYRQLETEFKRLIKGFSNISTVKTAEISNDAWGNVPKPINPQPVQGLFNSRNLIDDPWGDDEPSKGKPINTGIFVDPTPFFSTQETESHSNQIRDQEVALRHFQIQYVQELNERIAALVSDLQRLQLSPLPLAEESRFVSIVDPQAQAKIEKVEAEKINPTSLPVFEEAVNPSLIPPSLIKPVPGTLGEVKGIASSTDLHQQKVQEYFQKYAEKTNPLSTIKGAKSIKRDDIDQIAVLYIQVKEAAARAIQSLNEKAERLKEIINVSNNDEIIAEAKAALIKINYTKGQVTKYVSSNVLKGATDDESLAAAERQSLIGKRIENSKLETQNPEMFNRLRKKIELEGDRTSRVMSYDPTLDPQTTAVDKPILTAAAQRIKNRKLSRQDADREGGFFRFGRSQSNEGSGISLGLNNLIKDVGQDVQDFIRRVESVMPEGYKKAKVALVKARDARLNAKKFATKGYPYAQAHQMPRLPELPPDQDPLYNAEWGKYYDDQIAGLKPKKPPFRGHPGPMDFQAAGLAPTDRKQQMVENHQNGFLDRLYKEAVGEKAYSTISGLSGFFKKKTTKSQDLTIPQLPKIEHLDSGFIEDLQEQQLAAFQSKMNSKVSKKPIANRLQSRNTDAGYIDFGGIISAINNKVEEAIDKTESNLKKTLASASKVTTKFFQRDTEKNTVKTKTIKQQVVETPGQAINLGFKTLDSTTGFLEKNLGRLYSGLKLVGFAMIAMLGADSIQGLVSGFMQLSNAGTQAGRSFELLQFQAANAVGTASKANKLIAQTDREASIRGIDLNSARATAIQFQAATKDTPFEGEVAKFISDNISKGAVAKGLSAEQTSRASVGFLQATAKERLSPEEITGQIAEAGFYDIKPTLARSIGVPTSSIEKLSKSNQLGTPEILKLVSTIGSDAEASPLDAGKTINASFTRLDNSGQQFLENMGSGTKNILPLIDTLASGIDIVGDNLDVIGSIVNGVVVYGFIQLGIALTSTIRAGGMAASILGMVGNTIKGLAVQMVGILGPMVLVTIGIESLFSIYRNLKGETVFDGLADNVSKNLQKMRENIAEMKGLKIPAIQTEQDQKDRDKEFGPANWFDQGLDNSRQNSLLGQAAKLFNGGKGFTTQRELNEERGREKVFTEVLPNTRGTIDLAKEALQDEARIKKIADLREKLAQNKIAQEKTDETFEGTQEYERLKKEQNKLEIEKIKTEKPITNVESTLAGQKAQLQDLLERNALPDQKQVIQKMLDEITVVQTGFKKFSSAVSETTRIFLRNTEALTRYDRALDQARARISIQGSKESAASYVQRSKEGNDIGLNNRNSELAIAADRRELQAIETDLEMRKKNVSQLRSIVGSDTIKLDPVKNKKEYDQVQQLDKEIARKKEQAAKLRTSGDDAKISQSYDLETDILRKEQARNQIAESKSNLTYDADKLSAVKAAEDKLLSLVQEAAAKRAAIVKGEVERRIQLEREGIERIEFFYNRISQKSRIVAANNQAGLIPIQEGQTKVEFGERESGVNLVNAQNTLKIEQTNQAALKKAIDDKTIKLTREEVDTKLLDAELKVSEARKAVLEAEKNSILAMTATTVRQLEMAEAKVAGINARIERDAAVSASRASRAALTPVNLKQSFLAIDVSDTVNKLQTLKNEAASVDAARQQLANRKAANEANLSPANQSALTEVFGVAPQRANVDQLTNVRDQLKAIKDQTPQQAEALNYAEVRLEIDKEEVNLEAKKTVWLNPSLMTPLL
jgi:hypothetical protein